MGILSYEECKEIHHAAPNVLWDVGVRVEDPGIVRLLQDGGAQVVFRNRRANWEASGKPTLGSAVCSKIKKILQAEPRVYLDASQERELERLEQLGLAELAR